MVPTQHQRSACFGLAIWLNLSMFRRWITSPSTWKAFALWFLMDHPCLSEDRRRRRNIVQQIRWTITGERFQRIATISAEVVLLVLICLMLYTWASSECALRNDCTFASAHWANWLFSR